MSWNLTVLTKFTVDYQAPSNLGRRLNSLANVCMNQHPAVNDDTVTLD